MDKVTPKKSLGQHFLTDHNIARKIIRNIDIDSCKNVIELGPGTGILTKYLVELDGIDLMLVEIDKQSVQWLAIHYPELENKTINKDFLKLDVGTFFHQPFILIGNFPYNISSQIFFKVLEYKDLVIEVVCMIQKEVAERINAGPGSKTYGILSVFLQTFYDIEYLFTVNENVFNPPPKVKSAVIKLNRNNRTSLPCSLELFFKVVKASFNQRRKMMRNSLKAISPELPDTILLQKRPEQLGVEDFIKLTALIEKK
ncbi:MAG: 16S rRNA (adenine(1518)-N(6)/adenine(1519)-N(6))-dimethyltransferase RsmA [Bacteroidales bacterium]|nr:16S rRNA (adenine(1518)-N(6)/adenine(1519)-N(6))-dimethyltransferase RsmA [Bacteroidales bacterium]